MPSLPKGRTLQEFQPLMPAEEKILHAVATGEYAIIGESRPLIPGQDSLVRAEFLRFLALGGDAEAPVHEKGIEVHGATITGTLDLSNADIRTQLILANCTFEKAPQLYNTKISGLFSLQGSFLRGLNAECLECHSDLFLKNGFEAHGEVCLVGAKIAGNLDCAGGKFNNFTKLAVNAEGITVSGSVVMSINFEAYGEVKLAGAKIGGEFDCSGGKFKNFNRLAIHGEGMTVSGSVFMKNGFEALGLVQLVGAKIGRVLQCSGGKFMRWKRSAIDAEGMVVSGSVLMNDGFAAHGEVQLGGVSIGSNLECSGGKFENPNGYAISADGMIVSGVVFLRNGFKAHGEVRLARAKIGIEMDCSGGFFKNPDGDAINAEGMTVSGAFVFRNVTVENGTVNLGFARVAYLIDDQKSWPKSIVLDGFVYGSFRSPKPLQELSQKSQESSPTRAEERLQWLDKQSPEHSGKAKNPREFRPQPWQQLRKVLHDDGHYEDARRVAIAFENRKRECGAIGEISSPTQSCLKSFFQSFYSYAARSLHRFYGFAIGYGYRPLRLLGFSVVLWLISTLVFFSAAEHKLFVPKDPTNIGLFEKPAYDTCNPEKNPKGNWTSCTSLPPGYPDFHSLVYALDVMLPITKLGQEDHWTPINPSRLQSWAAWVFAWFTRILVWIDTLFSWIAGALLLATFTGLIKRQDE